MRNGFGDIERNIARCRVILSAVAIVTVYIDPTRPTLTRWVPLTGGAFTIDPYVLAVMVSHLAYSLLVYARARSVTADAATLPARPARGASPARAARTRRALRP
jgi:hypothetical protein